MKAKTPVPFVERLHVVTGTSTSRALAEKLNLSYHTIQRYKNGERTNPEIETLKAIAKVGISLNWVLFGIGDMFASIEPDASRPKTVELSISHGAEVRIKFVHTGQPALDVKPAPAGEETEEDSVPLYEVNDEPGESFTDPPLKGRRTKSAATLEN
jgi:transcriptional regulator with XRE-family HTH domain